MRWVVPVLACAILLTALPAPEAQEVIKGTFAVSADRLWIVTEAVLKQLGWEIDKADRSIGWITTNSRRLEGEDYGVYAKGTRHRLRVIIKDAASGRASVTIEREVFKRERILMVDKDEPAPTSDRSVERDILNQIAKAL
jgi:hypothetical protein